MNPKREPLTTADLANVDEARRLQQEQEQAAIREARVESGPSGTARALDTAMVGSADERPAVARTRNESPLFAEQDATELRRQWSDVQAGFVDEPRAAVKQADGLVADVMKRLAETFASERANLEHQWDRGDDVTTEDLRLVLQRYRSFFDRLLAV